MKVWLGFEHYYNYCDEFKSVVKVFDDEVKAFLWKEEFEPTEQEWRSTQEYEVE